MWSDADIEILTEALHITREAGYRPQFFFRAYSDESFLVRENGGLYLIVETFPNPSVREATQAEYEKFMQ